MLAQTFEQLIIKRQFRNTPKDRKDLFIIGYDTETIEGRAELIANSLGDYIYPFSFDDIVNFFCRDKTRGSIGFFYNLKYDFQACLKWLPPDDWITIYHKGELIYKTDNGKQFKVTYIPKKLLSLKQLGKNNKSRTWNFYDIAQYYGRMSLNNAALKYFNETKTDISNYDITNLTYQDLLKPDLREYCIQDCKLTERLSHRWVAICHTNDLYPVNFCSPASIASRYFQTRIKYPTINRFCKRSTRKYLIYPWEAISGAYISVMKRGYFSKVYSYDVNSQYPNQMKDLPDLDKGKFFLSKGGIIEGAVMGWLRCRLEIWPDDIGFYNPPLPIKRKNLSNCFPAGVIETTITLKEYERLKEYYDIEVFDGLYWIPETLEYPFRDLVTSIYKNRINTQDENVKYFLKIVLNGIYGKNLERHQILDEDHENFGKWETGNLFNPFYGSYILAGARLQIFDALLTMKQSNVIACFTDSILTDKPLLLPLSDQIGQWSLDFEGEAVIIGCGVYTLKDNEKVKSRVRGFETTSRVDLFDLIKRQYKKSQLELDITINISPLTAIIQKIPEQMNYITKGIKTIDINFDSKRLWTKYPRQAGYLLNNAIDSLPIINQL